MTTTEYRQSRLLRPPGAAELLLIRHGESAAVRPGESFPLTDGRGDPDLAPEGRKHADRLADRLGGERFDAVYVTPLRRTQQTAAPLAAKLGIAPTVAPGLAEVFLGDWENGLFQIKAAQHDPVVQRVLAEQRWDLIPGAESMAALAERVRLAVTEIAAAHPDQRVAVCTHAGVIGQILALATGSQPFAFVGADNGSISRIFVLGERWILRGYNDTGHLDQF